MSGAYQNFLGNLNKYGVAKTSHFRLNLPLSFRKDKDDKSEVTNINEIFGYRCETTELPGRQLVSNDSRVYGPSYKTPYQSVYQEITLTFVETASFFVREVFERWMNLIFNSSTNKLAYPQTYRYFVTLTQYDMTTRVASDQIKDKPVDQPQAVKHLNPIAVWSMYDAFPTAINQMPVSWSEDGLHRTTVTLAYEYYTLVTGLNAVTNPMPNWLVSPKFNPRGSVDT